MLKNHKKYLKEIFISIKKFLPDARVLIFGSVVEDKLVGGSDIDVIIIADVPKKHMKRAELIAKIEEDTQLSYVHPFDFHLLTQEEFDDWNSIYNLNIKAIEDYLNLES